jgi:hypothetical protein
VYEFLSIASISFGYSASFFFDICYGPKILAYCAKKIGIRLNNPISYDTMSKKNEAEYPKEIEAMLRNSYTHQGESIIGNRIIQSDADFFGTVG